MDAARTPPPTRVGSIDAFRGLVMFLMLAEVLHLRQMAQNFPNSSFWSFLAFHQTHVAWAGCSLHDLIQPSFSFLVGVALPFSLANRLLRGQSVGRMTLHAGWRALLLILLGIGLRLIGKRPAVVTLEDTLTQIGLGYVPLFLLGLAAFRRRWPAWLALVVILVSYWTAFALYPLPGPDFDYRAVGVPADWPHHYQGFAAHWNKNSNLAWAFDTWFLNLFPRERPFAFNGGGYATLSFIPTLATMLLGLLAGTWLRTKRSAPIRKLVTAGVLCLALGWAADAAGVCPNVKRIWTPAWTLFSGGWCFLILAGFYAVIDRAGFRAWAYPLRVVGLNSIAAYVIAHLTETFVLPLFPTQLGATIIPSWAGVCEPVLSGAVVLSAYWLILWAMERRRLVIRV